MKFEESKSDTSAWTSFLAFTNGVLSQRYGLANRPYISHVPYFLDKRILKAFVKAFAKEAEITMSNKFRTSTDFILAFGYYNFVMDEREHYPEKVILDELSDTVHFFGKSHF